MGILVENMVDGHDSSTCDKTGQQERGDRQVH